MPGSGCNRSAAAGHHFPLNQGRAIAHFRGGNASWCQQQCCGTATCTGWIFTTAQTGRASTVAPCNLGGACCWLKSGVTSMEPAANCTAGLSRPTPPPEVAVGGMAMVGATLQRAGGTTATARSATSQHREHVPTAAAPRNVTAAVWLYNTAHTWKLQPSGAAHAVVGPVVVDLAHMAACGDGDGAGASARGCYTARVFNTTDGAQIAALQGLPTTGPDSTVSFTLPPFVGDVAILVERNSTAS